MVRLEGLTRRPDLNGRRVIWHTVGEDGRLECAIDEESGARVRPCNVVHRLGMDVGSMVLAAYANVSSGRGEWPMALEGGDEASPHATQPLAQSSARDGWTLDRAGDTYAFTSWACAAGACPRPTGIFSVLAEEAQWRLKLVLVRDGEGWRGGGEADALTWMLQRAEGDVAYDSETDVSSEEEVDEDDDDEEEDDDVDDDEKEEEDEEKEKEEEWDHVSYRETQEPRHHRR